MYDTTCYRGKENRFRLIKLDVTCTATNFTQTSRKNKNVFWNCHLAMPGRVANLCIVRVGVIFHDPCPKDPEVKQPEA